MIVAFLNSSAVLRMVGEHLMRFQSEASVFKFLRRWLRGRNLAIILIQEKIIQFYDFTYSLII